MTEETKPTLSTTFEFESTKKSGPYKRANLAVDITDRLKFGKYGVQLLPPDADYMVIRSATEDEIKAYKEKKAARRKFYLRRKKNSHK